MCRSSLITMLKLLHATTKMIAVTSGKEGGREGEEQSEGGRDRNDGWQKG